MQDLQIQGHLQERKSTRASARASMGTRAKPKASPISHNTDSNHSNQDHDRDDVAIEEEGEEEEDENDNIVVRLYERADQDAAMITQLRGDLVEAEERLEAFKVRQR